jgi:hypothetical protein
VAPFGGLIGKSCAEEESPIAIAEKYSRCFIVEVSNCEQTDALLPDYLNFDHGRPLMHGHW